MNRTLLILALLSCTSAMADSSNNNADIQNTGIQYKGNYNVNQAAGDQMQQTNTKAIAIGTNASANIGGNSFSNGNGILGVNQGAGANNQMANVTRVSISAAPQSVDASALSQQNVALLPSSGATGTSIGSRQVTTSDQAFTGSRGVIQVNQSAGVGNRMANTLSIRVAD